jgi:hypothetical protein
MTTLEHHFERQSYTANGYLEMVLILRISPENSQPVIVAKKPSCTYPLPVCTIDDMRALPLEVTSRISSLSSPLPGCALFEVLISVHK